MVYHTILDALGNTPLIELNHMTTPDQARIVVKYEGLNVGGSIKDAHCTPNDRRSRSAWDHRFRFHHR